MKNKFFDCVEMKNRIQQAMREEDERMGEKAAAEKRRRWLAHSNDPLACWWRSLAKPHDADLPSAVVREEVRDQGYSDLP